MPTTAESPVAARAVAQHWQSDADGRPRRYEVFLSTPMSAFSDEAAYASHRNFVIKLISVLRECAAIEDVYFAGDEVKTVGDFEAPEDALTKDLAALRDSEILLMVYPEKMVSSALVEAGIAMGLEKPCLFFVRRREDLPYLLVSAERVGQSDEMPTVKIFEYSDNEDLEHQLRSCCHEVSSLLQEIRAG